MEKTRLDQIIYDVKGICLDIHRELGAGLLESAYQAILFDEIRAKGYNVESEVIIPLVYKGKHYGKGYRADLIVESQLIIELK